MKSTARIQATASGGLNQNVHSGSGAMAKVWMYFEGCAKNLDDELDTRGEESNGVNVTLKFYLSN